MSERGAALAGADARRRQDKQGADGLHKQNGSATRGSRDKG